MELDNIQETGKRSFGEKVSVIGQRGGGWPWEGWY